MLNIKKQIHLGKQESVIKNFLFFNLPTCSVVQVGYTVHISAMAR